MQISKPLHHEVVVLLRVSTKGQSERGVGFLEQRAAVARFLDLQNLTAIRWFEESSTGKSGSIGDRPVLKEAVELAECAGVPIVVADVSRLARNHHVAIAVLDRVEVLVVDKGGRCPRPVFEAEASSAEAVGREISRRVKEALAKRRAGGVKLGSPSPASGGSARGHQHRQFADEQASKVIAELLRIRSEFGDLTHTELARKVNERGLRTLRGGPYTGPKIKSAARRVREMIRKKALATHSGELTN